MRPLAVIGNVSVDLIMGPAAPWPRPGTEVVVAHEELRVGGAAGNAALAWQGLGVDFDIAATVGADRFGRWLRDAFGRHARNWPASEEQTALSVGITHPDGERTFFSTLGHLASFGLGDALACLDGGRLAGGHLLVCGSFLTPRLAGDYEALFDWADRHGIAVALDTGWPPDGWTPSTAAFVRRWLSRCRVALFNEIEAAALAGDTHPAACAAAIRSAMAGDAIAVVKRGPAGALAVGCDGAQASAVAPPVEVVDTIGAGDVFNAVFLAALAGDKPLAACLAAGTRVASRAISTAPRAYGEAE